VGLEWLLPSGLLILMFLGIFSIFHAGWSQQALFVVIAIGWSVFMFNFLHDWMHIEGFWMERQRWLRGWFLRARRLHDIHHYSLDDDGRMDRNFGIGFSFFDRVFGTRAERLAGLNRKGLEAVRQRYDFFRDLDPDAK
jgi:sterol desaturase/sphingolipid hydroxylase (fatty acid hydroxylase superfamily)